LISWRSDRARADLARNSSVVPGPPRCEANGSPARKTRHRWSVRRRARESAGSFPAAQATGSVRCDRPRVNAAPRSSFSLAVPSGRIAWLSTKIESTISRTNDLWPRRFETSPYGWTYATNSRARTASPRTCPSIALARRGPAGAQGHPEHRRVGPRIGLVEVVDVHAATLRRLRSIPLARVHDEGLAPAVVGLRSAVAAHQQSAAHEERRDAVVRRVCRQRHARRRAALRAPVGRSSAAVAARRCRVPPGFRAGLWTRRRSRGRRAAVRLR
jgi:hypothetical protein